jgi:hypothetical protein
MFTQTRLILITTLAGVAILAGCAGQGTAPTSAQAQPVATLPAVSNGEGGGEAGGVEAALVTYDDAAQGFVIGYPGPWTQDKAVKQGVKFSGGDSSMTLEFVTAKGMDAMTYAQRDVAAVTTAFPGYKQLRLEPSTEVKNAIILGYEADGKSAVTGKPLKQHNERYYMPLTDGRIAVLTVVSSDKLYDMEGVRDIALTFKATK